MKKILLSISIYFLANTLSTQAQTLYGTSAKGGNGGGTINKFTPGTNNLIAVKSFETIVSSPYYTSFVEASDGKLYGMTGGGGNNESGAIFSYNPSSSTYSKVKDFSYADGAAPQGSLIQAKDGKLYGMTSRGGGTNGTGVIFSFDPSTFTYEKLKVFEDNDLPSGSLIQANDGKLYGMTSRGGNGYGIIFSFDPSSFTYSKLWQFHSENGTYPTGDLIQASDGKLYGMTSKGGISDVGVIFSFDPVSSIYLKLLDFDGINGAGPTGSLVQAKDGKLYGTTPNGNNLNSGVIFSLDPSSNIYTKFMDFDSNNGYNPSGNLVQAKDGKLYGMTSLGGVHSSGVIFSFNPSSSGYKKVKDFDYTHGGYPSGSLLQASDGKLYGLANGGISAYGVIFSFDPNSFAYKMLKDLGIIDGGSPTGSLVQASDGKLYGTATVGGTPGCGVIFSFDPAVSTYTKLWDFDCNVAGVLGSLIEASDGKLYGMTTIGGSFGVGIIYSFDPLTLTYTQLMAFNGVNGSGPLGSLMQASDGKLYGMTAAGGESGNGIGVIFSFNPSSNTYTKLKDLPFTIAGYPYGNLIQAKNGKLFGMTSGGSSSNNGDIFSYDISSNTITKLKDFNYTNGVTPLGSLLQASDGKLYGMTSAGGSKNLGVIFSFNLTSSNYVKLFDFDSTNGAKPQGSLVQAYDGKLYGTTSAGGSKNFGVVFSFDPSTSTYTKLKDYTGPNGANTGIGSAFIELKSNNESSHALNVSILQPVKDARYAEPAVIPLMADAKDPDGRVVKVEFYNSTVLLRTEYYPPYAWSWKNVPAGNYTFSAKAYDDKDSVAISAPVHVSVVTNQSPVISIVNPGSGQMIAAPANINLEASAEDIDGLVTKVAWYNGKVLLRTEYYPPYSWNWRDVPLGNYTITAKAYDNKGGFTISTPVHISVVPNEPPTVSVFNPINNQNFAGPASIKLQVNAKDTDGSITKVELYNSSTLLRTEYFTPFSWDWIGVPLGNYTLTAKAYDDKGGITTSAPVQISVVPNQPPTVSIVDPLDNQIFPQPAFVNLRATANDSDGTISKVELYNGQTLLRTEYYAPFSFSWNYVHTGKYTITAKATDNLGNVGESAPVRITVTSKPSSLMTQSVENSKTTITDIVSVKILPNPAKDMLTIQTSGFDQNKKLRISVIAVSGTTVKSIYATPGKLTQMQVSSLHPGVYFIKVLSAKKVSFNRFVKL